MSCLKNSRNLGIDFLRILSMFYVVILHTLGHGGILGAVSMGTYQYKTVWFLEIWAYCAVDIFALISGYVGYHEEKRTVKYSNYILLWEQVVFYGILVTFILKFFYPESISMLDMLGMLFPVTNGLYWYFTAYTGLFFCIPMVNIAMTKCSSNFAIKIFVAFIGVFSVYDIFVGRFNLEQGYSFVWLLVLYVLGSVLKKCEIGKKINFLKALIGIVLLILFTWIWKLYGIEYSFLGFRITKDTFVSYTSSTILGAALFYIIGFSKIQFNHFKKIISFAASGAFAVYLLNEHVFFRKFIIEQNFVKWSESSAGMILVKVCVFSGIFIIVSIIIDIGRQKLFKMLRLDCLAAVVEKRIKIITDR